MIEEKSSKRNVSQKCKCEQLVIFVTVRKRPAQRGRKLEFHISVGNFVTPRSSKIANHVRKKNNRTGQGAKSEQKMAQWVVVKRIQDPKK